MKAAFTECREVPVTEGSGRIHINRDGYWFCLRLKMLIKIEEKDLRIDTFCSSKLERAERKRPILR